jgi:hypothetical protein
VGQPETDLTTREQEADFCMQERLSKIETRLEHLETKLSQVCWRMLTYADVRLELSQIDDLVEQNSMRYNS